ncbi:unnamed protein product, partial [Ectocarpus sp. 8 AP-2014]
VEHTAVVVDVTKLCAEPTEGKGLLAKPRISLRLCSRWVAHGHAYGLEGLLFGTRTRPWACPWTCPRASMNVHGRFGRSRRMRQRTTSVNVHRQTSTEVRGLDGCVPRRPRRRP